MFRTRLISGIVLVLLALLFNIVGGDLLFVVTLVLSLIGLFELYRALQIEKDPIGFVGYAACIGYYLTLRLLGREDVMLALICGIFILMIVYVLRFPHYHASEIMSCFFGIVYVPVMLSYIYQTRMLPGGEYLVWLIFISAWGCDTCAYCVGMLIGKHKMTPALSPKKTIEGAIGGVAGAALIGFLYAFALIGVPGNAKGRLWEYAVICAVGGLISMVGDLAASGIKRDHKIKDYGKIIPGHGGIMDRFDSVIFTAPVIYGLGKVFLHF